MKYSEIFIFEHEDTRMFHEYFDYNSLPYTKVDLWNDYEKANVIPDYLTNKKNVCLILGTWTLVSIHQSEKTFNSFVRFLQNNTIISAKDTGNDFEPLDIPEFVESLSQLNDLIPYQSLKYHLFSVTCDTFWMKQLHNIDICDHPMVERYVNRMPIIINACTNKNKNCKYDYMSTVCVKADRPGRKELQTALEQRKKLHSKGLNIFRHWSEPYIGQLNPQCLSDEELFNIDRTDGPANVDVTYPSMDLYRDAWMELVCETNLTRIHNVSEKTLKTFVTKTPAIFLSTCGYLEYLKSLGFKTFHPYIDESYDLEPDLAKRTEMVLDSLENAVEYGGKKLYHELQTTLDHNFNKYAELCGRWRYDIDLYVKDFFE